MYSTSSRPLNEFYDKAVGEFVPVSRRRFLFRVAKALDSRTPVTCDKSRAQKIDGLTLTPCNSDTGAFVGWEITIPDASDVIWGSSLYIPGNGQASAKKKVRQTIHLDGLVVTRYNDGSLLLFYRGNYPVPRFKRGLL